MIYLYEHHAGFDAAAIGFPSISGCHAIVLQADTGLYGYHSLGGTEVARARTRAAGFAQFVRNHAIGMTPQLMFGVCFVGARGYGGDVKQGWRDEIFEYADALGLDTAEVRGFDIGTKLKEKIVKGTTVTQSAYVEFRLAGGSTTVHYKRWRKMQDSNAPAPVLAPNAFTKIHQVNGTLIAPDKPMKPVEIIATRSNKGEYHPAEIKTYTTM